jgi:heat shock protein beta
MEGYYDKFYDKSSSMKLYVRKVLISDEFEDFMPRYLSFIKGVVDSDDLPLNVNRETLAQNRLLKVMGKKLTRKALEMIKKIAEDQQAANEKKDEGEEATEETEEEKKKREEDKTAYDTFWNSFGKSVKLGVIDDRANKVALTKLLRFKSTKSGDSWRSFEQYFADMTEKQNYIYYITGANLEVVKSSPFLEKMEKKGFEVLFMIDPLDEYLVQQVSEFEGKKLMSLSKEGLKLGENKKRIEKLEEEYKDFTSWLKGVYGDKVEKVTISNRIAKSPAVLVTGQYGWTANMERIMKAQTFSDNSQQQWMAPKKTMEINPRHPLIKELKRRSTEDGEDKDAVEVAALLYDSALLASGFHMENPTDFINRINRVMSIGMKVDPSTPVEEEPEDEPEEEAAPAEPAGGDDDSNPEDMMENLMKNMETEKEEHDEL